MAEISYDVHMKEVGKLERQVAELQRELQSRDRAVAKLNNENARRRKEADDLRAAASEGAPPASGRDDQVAKLVAELKRTKAAAAKASGCARQQTIRAELLSAGCQQRAVKRVAALIGHAVPDSQVADAVKILRGDWPEFFNSNLGGPSNFPGSKGGTGGAPSPKSMSELMKDPKTGRPTPERWSAFAKSHPREAAQMREAAGGNISVGVLSTRRQEQRGRPGG